MNACLDRVGVRIMIGGLVGGSLVRSGIIIVGCVIISWVNRETFFCLFFIGIKIIKLIITLIFFFFFYKN